MTTRQQVYAAIDGERTYQTATMEADPIKYKIEGNRSVGDYLTILATYLRIAQDSYTFNGNEIALHQIRKLAAVAVSCMEDHGALPRVAPEEVRDPIPW